MGAKTRRASMVGALEADEAACQYRQAKMQQNREIFPFHKCSLVGNPDGATCKTGICLTGRRVDDRRTTMLDLNKNRQGRYLYMIPSTGRTVVHHVR